jgi:hypothetical protein
MKTRYIDVLIIICLLWAGMIAGISFLEAPVKFTAPSLTLAIGLDVGRHVFSAFNKVEIILCTLMIVLVFKAKLILRINVLLGIAGILLILQCFWLLPVLDERALIIIAGGVPEGSSPHVWYIVFDAVKLTVLISAAYYCLKEIRSKFSDK